MGHEFWRGRSTHRPMNLGDLSKCIQNWEAQSGFPVADAQNTVSFVPIHFPKFVPCNIYICIQYIYIYIQYSPIQLMYLFENLFSCKVSGCFSPCVFPLSSHSVLPKCQGINRTRTCRGVSRCCENFRCFPAQENSSVRQPETKHMVILLDSKKTEQKQW